MNDIDPTIPNGVIIDPKPTDYVSGDGNLGAIASRVLVPDGDWTSYTPKGERQSGNGFDSDDCTAFGYTNVLETQWTPVKQVIGISSAAMQFLEKNGYLDSDGTPNFSDRALGSMAGTTSAGNSLNKVADTARKFGLIPESKWPSVFTNYADYYKPIPDELKALALEFLNYFELPYEQVFSHQLQDALNSAPLYVALVTCGGWNNPEPPPIAWCNAGNATNHAVCLLKQNNFRIFDSYNPFVKDLATDYTIPYFYKILLNPKQMSQVKIAVIKGEAGIFLAASDPQQLVQVGKVFGREVQLGPDGKTITNPDINV